MPFKRALDREEGDRKGLEERFIVLLNYGHNIIDISS